MPVPIRLVAGLGNPGRGYAATRHNAGFWFANALADKLGASFASEAKFAADVARSADLRIAKPMTFMNLSGRTVAGIARFFDIPEEAILVVHDELDLMPGEAKLKWGGGVAGHNGLRDIKAQLGTADFWRLRLGIGHPRNSALPEREVVDYVLKPPDAGERAEIESAIEKALLTSPDILAGTLFTIIILLSEIPNAIIKRAAKAGDVPTIRLLLPLMVAVGVVLLIIRGFEFNSLNCRWTDDAYASIIWALLLLHAAHILTDWLDTVVLCALMFTPVAYEPRRWGDVDENSMYWRYVWMLWIPIYLMIYWVPRL